MKHHPLELAPFESLFNGCRGIKGPVPPPLFIRVSIYLILNVLSIIIQNLSIVKCILNFFPTL